MVTFFRSIRKGFIDSSSTRKYLFYALGEILLVMIGILLALQVNNWNEKRKSIINEKNYVRSIYQDLKEDVGNIKTNLETLSDHYYLGLEVLEALEILESKSSQPIDSIKIATNLGWKLSQVIPVDRDENTWDKLKVLGTETYIIDDSLTMVLNDFYAKYDKQIERFNQLPKKLRQDLRELTGYCHNSIGLKVMREKGIEFYGASSPQTRKCILSIDKNQKLVGAIMVTSIVNTRIYEDLKNDANVILKLLKESFNFINDET